MVSETTNSHVYPKANEGGETAHVAPNPSFPKLEESVLDYWEKDDTFQKSIERRPSGDHSQNDSSSSTARRSPTACRTMATC